MPRKPRLNVGFLERRETPDSTPHNIAVSNFYQNWNDASLIMANDDWSGVPSVVGYLGDDTFGEGVDPQTILTPYSTVDVIANQGSNTALTAGGVAEFDGLANRVIALQADATADAPNVVVSINTTGRSNIVFSYNLRDLDASTDNAIQRVALQYRVGNAGNYVNVSAGFVADATGGPSVATKVTPVSVTLPNAVDNQSLVQVRIITTNAVGNDEWVGVDDIVINTREFIVNTTTTLEQTRPSVAVDAVGNAVVTWMSNGQDGSGNGVLGQRFDAEGAKVGGEFLVNSYTTDFQGFPSVAMDADGDTIIVWRSNQDGSDSSIHGQRYNAAGAKAGGEFQVNTYTTGGQESQSVAMDADGNFIVVYESLDQSGIADDILGQQFDSAGMKVGGEFRVNTYTLGSQNNPSVAVDTDGDIFVVWQSANQDGYGSGIYGQRFNAAGTKVGGEFRVNTYTTDHQSNAAVAIDADGDAVVVWTSGQDGNNWGIFGQRFNAAGTKVGLEFQVNSYTTNRQVLASVALDSDGDFLVTWESYLQDGSDLGVYGQRFNAVGIKVGGEFQLNAFASNKQRYPKVDLDADGDAFVVWTSVGQDGSLYGSYGQRFRSPNPPSRFTNTQINNGSPQRSLVTSLQITFDSPVTFTGNPSAAFSLVNQKTTDPVTLSAAVDVSGTIVTLTFTGGSIDSGGSLADGLYTLTILGNQFTGNGFDGNGDGITGDNFQLIGTPVNGLFRLFGDADGNGTVSASDFNAFRLAYGSGSSIFDFDNDGQTNAFDFNQFRLRYGMMVGP